jgi:hypothetical protein
MADDNITLDAGDVWHHATLEGTIHCTDQERMQLQALIDLGLHGGLRLCAPPDTSFSWWDYRDVGFKRNRGMRIDHILVTKAVKDATTPACRDKKPTPVHALLAMAPSRHSTNNAALTRKPTVKSPTANSHHRQRLIDPDSAR